MVYYVNSSLKHSSLTKSATSGTYTFAGWCTMHSVAGFRAILSVHRDTPAAGIFILHGASAFRFFVFDSGGSGFVQHIDGTIGADDWFHLAIVRSSPTSVHLWVNGVQQVENTRDVTGEDELDRLQLGGSTYNSLSPCNGQYAAWKAWNRVLSADEIRSEMHQRMPVSYDEFMGSQQCITGKLDTDFTGVGTAAVSGTPTTTTQFEVPIGWGGDGPAIVELPSAITALVKVIDEQASIPEVVLGTRALVRLVDEQATVVEGVVDQLTEVFFGPTVNIDVELPTLNADVDMPILSADVDLPNSGTAVSL